MSDDKGLGTSAGIAPPDFGPAKKLPPERPRRHPLKAPPKTVARKEAAPPVETRNIATAAELGALPAASDPERDPTFDGIDIEQLSRSSLIDAQQTYLVPEELRKPGWVYQFVTVTILGQPVDPSEIALTLRQGWIPCKEPRLRRHFCGINWNKQTIEIGGQQLFMRPKRINDAAREEAWRNAEEQKNDKLKRALAAPLEDRPGHVVEGVRKNAEQFEQYGEIGAYKGDPMKAQRERMKAAAEGTGAS